MVSLERPVRQAPPPVRVEIKSKMEPSSVEIVPKPPEPEPAPAPYRESEPVAEAKTEPARRAPPLLGTAPKAPPRSPRNLDLSTETKEEPSAVFEPAAEPAAPVELPPEPPRESVEAVAAPEPAEVADQAPVINGSLV